MVKKRRTHSRFRIKRLGASLSVLVVIAGIALVALGYYHNTHPKTTTSNSKATIDTKLQPSPASSGLSTKVPVSSPGIAQGSATQNTGSSTPTSSPSQWTVSQSGVITVKEPIANATFKSGDIVAGSASVSQVEYRIIDNDVGQIAEGPINVVNGTFSATLTFTPHASSGQLDVFSYSTTNLGVEVNEVQVPINF